MECRIDYNLLDINGILSLIKEDCIDCNLKVRMLKKIRCHGCPFVSCSGERKTRKNYFTTGIACGAKFRQYGIDPNGRLGKSYLFYFLYHPELQWSLPSISTTKQWVIHHENSNNWNDHIWNLILCLSTEHSSFEATDNTLQKRLNEHSYMIFQ